MSAFLCGTFVLALGLALVLDPDDDDDQPLILTTGAATETQAPAAKPQTQKKLKVAKTHKLRPKKTALKKRSKRFFHLHESGPPVQANQRPRRGVTQTPHLALPTLGPQLDIPLPSLARLRPRSARPDPIPPQLRRQLIRGPPASVLA